MAGGDDIVRWFAGLDPKDSALRDLPVPPRAGTLTEALGQRAAFTAIRGRWW